MKIDLGCTMEQLVEAVNEASAAPSNMVTTDSAQTISGAKTFTKTTTFQNDIKANGSAGTSGQVLMSQGAGNSPKWGDAPIPTLYLAQGLIVTQGGNSFSTPAIPCTTNSISWTEYNALFPEPIPVNITYRSGNDVILVTSIIIGTISGDAVIETATETNLTTGEVTDVTGPQDYSLDELIVNKIV
nr:MAG TPA: hypothetical protein [Bacteriophage sp.]